MMLFLFLFINRWHVDGKKTFLFMIVGNGFNRDVMLLPFLSLMCSDDLIHLQAKDSSHLMVEVKPRPMATKLARPRAEGMTAVYKQFMNVFMNKI